MTQARRKKRRSKRSTGRKTTVATNSGWAMLAIGLISGVILTALYVGARDTEINFGGGLKNLYDKHQDKRERQAVTTRPQQVVTKSKEVPHFDYYTVLPEYEQVLPDDYPLRPKRKASKSTTSNRFIVQAASFSQHTEADQ